MSKNRLFDEFSPVSKKEWKQKIQFDLKGADYNETLVWESPEGIKVKPFYHADDAVNTPKNLTNGSGWKTSQSIFAGDAQCANKKALLTLRRELESIRFRIPSEEIKIVTLLKDIDLKEVSVYLEMEFLSKEYMQTIIDFCGNYRVIGCFVSA